MRWPEILIGIAVSVGFWVLKIVAELVWEGLKARLRRELGRDAAPSATPATESAAEARLELADPGPPGAVNEHSR